jgi:hypothetical protein
MTRNQKDHTFDLATILKDAGLVGADNPAQVSGANQILDLGQARTDGTVVIDATAVEVASGDEVYRINMQYSASATFASGVVQGSGIMLGDQAVILGVDTDAGAGHYEFGTTNEINGTTYRYARLYTEVVGTVATGVNYIAHLATQ